MPPIVLLPETTNMGREIHAAVSVAVAVAVVVLGGMNVRAPLSNAGGRTWLEQRIARAMKLQANVVDSAVILRCLEVARRRSAAAEANS